MSTYKFITAVSDARQAQGDTPSASPVFRNSAFKDADPKLEVSTLYELFDRSANKYAEHPCLGYRPKGPDGKVGDFVFQSYKETAEQVTAVASGLRSLGVEPKQRVGVYGPNSIPWMVTMQVSGRVQPMRKL